MPAIPGDRKGTIRKEMKKFKRGTLHSGSPSGPVVKNRAQALAIALHEGDQAVGKRPKKR